MAEATTCTGGIFFAADDVIFGFCPDDTANPDFSDVQISRENSTRNIEKDIDAALRGLLALSGGLRVRFRSICCALPGPINMSGNPMECRVFGSGTVDDNYGTFGYAVRRTDLKGINFRELFRSRLATVGGAASPFEGCKPVIYHDAAAYAYGDYSWRRNDYVRSARGADARELRRREFVRRTIFCHALLDEGIGGAIIAKSLVAQGPVHSEIGHIYVQRASGDLAFPAKCANHQWTGCLESLVGLPALRSRFGDDFLERIYPTLGPESEELDLIAYYVSQLMVSFVLTVAPSVITLSGRLATGNEDLIRLVRGYTRRLLEQSPRSRSVYPGYQGQNAPDFITLCKDSDVGVYGAVLLGRPETTRGMDGLWATT